MDRGGRGHGRGAHLWPRQWLCDRKVQAVAFRRHTDHAVGGAQPGADRVEQQDGLPVWPGREAVRRARRRQPVRHPVRRDRYGGDRRRPDARHGEHKLGPIHLRDRRQRAGGAVDRHSGRAGQGLRLRHQQSLGRSRRHSDGWMARIRHQRARRRLRAAGHRRNGHRRHRPYGRLRHSLRGGDRRRAHRNRAQRACCWPGSTPIGKARSSVSSSRARCCSSGRGERPRNNRRLQQRRRRKRRKVHEDNEFLSLSRP